MLYPSKKKIILCNGFGFSDKFWTNLLHELQNKSYSASCDFLPMSLGYFESNRENQLKCKNTSSICDDINNEVYIGIGHSLGLMKLILSKIKFRYLIGINGFINFLGNDSILRRQRYAEYIAFKENFLNAPQQTLQKFYIKCGLQNYHEDFNSINVEILWQDLNLICNDITHHINQMIDTSIIIINSKGDTIVPRSLIYDNFHRISSATIHSINHDKHALGYIDPTIITDLLNKLMSN